MQISYGEKNEYDKGEIEVISFSSCEVIAHFHIYMVQCDQTYHAYMTDKTGRALKSKMEMCRNIDTIYDRASIQY